MNWTRMSVSVIAMAVAASGAAAQEWDYRATLYLFMPETTSGISTPARSLETTLKFSEALDNLDFAFMGTFEAHNGTIGFAADLVLTDISVRVASPTPQFNTALLDTRTSYLSGYFLYRPYTSAGLALDLAAGFRFVDTDTIVGLQGPGPGPNARFARDWVDPVVGARATFDFSDRWSGMVFADYGGFSSDSETWQIAATVSYAINENWSLSGGYRHIEFDHTENGVRFEYTQSGPVLGVTYKF